MDNIKIFACPTAEEFTAKVAEHLGIPVSECEVMKFKNDNSFCQYKESVRGQDIYLVCSSVPNVNDRVMESLVMIDAAVRASAKSINVVLPYYNYSRSDKKDQPRIPVTASMLARIYETAGATRVITCDLHNPAIQAFFTIPCDVLSAQSILTDYFKGWGNIVVVATDAGSTKKAYKYARNLNAPVAMIDKRREGNDDRAIASTVIGDVKGKVAIMFDDEVSTAGTLCEAAKVLKAYGATDIYAACTHGVLCGPAIERINSSDIKELVITDTVPILNKDQTKIKVLTASVMFANAIKRIHNEEPLGGLY